MRAKKIVTTFCTIASAHIGAIIGIPNGIVRHIGPVCMGCWIINFNVVVFGLAQ